MLAAKYLGNREIGIHETQPEPPRPGRYRLKWRTRESAAAICTYCTGRWTAASGCPPFSATK